MVKAFKYRIYPNKSQEILLSKTFGCVRLIWNANVASFNSYDKEDNPKPNIIQNLITTIMRDNYELCQELRTKLNI